MFRYDDSSEAARQYAEAYASHYAAGNLPRAIRVYNQVIAHHPSTAEAGYARAQIQNIVNRVVPVAELLAAQVKLALRYLQPNDESATTAVVP